MTDAAEKRGVMTERWRAALVWALRIVVGGVFVMSGFVKMIDPWGFLFKLEEYLAVWHMAQPRTLVLIAVLFVAGYEFVMGALLLLGCYKRVASQGIALMMAVMLPLTFYVWIADPVSDCGCFGEFLVISNAATFWKNVAISVCVVFLVLWNSKVKQGFFQPAIQWMVGAWLTLYILLIGLYGYNIQPLLDFRPFPTGTALASEADEADDEVYAFVYVKDGEQREFYIDNLPDSTWTFVDRHAVGGTAREIGRPEKRAEDTLAVFDGDENVTDDVITADGPMLLLVIPEPVRADVSHTFTVNEMYEYADSIGMPMAALLGGGMRAIERWKDMAMAEYPIYSADDTQLKELARGTMSVVTLDDGVVVSKNSVAMLNPTVIEFPESREQFMREIEGTCEGVLMWLNVVFGGGLVILYLTQGIILGIRFGIRKGVEARRKKREKAWENRQKA